MEGSWGGERSENRRENGNMSGGKGGCVTVWRFLGFFRRGEKKAGGSERG